MNQLLTITWDMSRGLDLGVITLRYYSLLFALGFILGYMLMRQIFKKEGVAQEKLDTLLTYTVIATILGARLGHVFFYQWDYYSQHPGEILKVWEGGLASHGAAVAIIIAVIYYSKKSLKKPALWMFDRLVITIALAAALIRVGNWFNSEIYGDIANSNIETVFTDPVRHRVLDVFPNTMEAIDFEATESKLITDSLVFPIYKMSFTVLPTVKPEHAESTLLNRIRPYVNSLDKDDKNILFMEDTKLTWSEENKQVLTVEVLGVPRHPTQLYEAFAYLLIFLVLYRLYLLPGIAGRQGFIFGSFLVLLFGFRFFIEYYKEIQVSREAGMALNMGQYLSIPLVLIGLYFIITSKKKLDDQAK